MPLLAFPFFSKRPDLQKGGDHVLLTTPQSNKQSTLPTRDPRDVPLDWPALDLFLRLQRCYEAGRADVRTGVHGLPSGELSTAELTTWVCKVMRCDSADANEMSKKSALDGTSMAALIVEELHQHIEALQHALSVLRCGTSTRTSHPSHLSAVSTLIQTSESRALLRTHVPDTTQNNEEEAADNEASVTALTRVVGSSFYTISAFLDAVAASSNDAEGSHSEVSLSAASLEVNTTLASALPLIFHLIIQTLDLADAAGVAAVTHTLCLSSLTSVLQRDGSLVLRSLLQMRSPAGGMRWVVARHVLRRLRPLLFRSAVHGDSLSGGKSIGEVDGLCCDATDAGLVLWLTERVLNYCTESNGSAQVPAAAAAAALMAPPPPLSPAVPFASFVLSTMSISLEVACVTELLDALTQQLATPSTCLPHCERSRSTERADTDGSSATDEGGCQCTSPLPSARFAEYACLLRPAMKKFDFGAAGSAAPPSLREAVRELAVALQHHGLLE